MAITSSSDFDSYDPPMQRSNERIQIGGTEVVEKVG